MQPPAIPNAPSQTFCPGDRHDCDGQDQVVLVGASVRSAAQSAQNAGFCVTGIDLFGDTDTRLACHRYFPVPTQETAQSIASQCAGLPVIAVGGLSGEQPIAQMLAAKGQNLSGPIRDVNKQEKKNQLCDVGYLQRVAAEAGMQFPPTRLAAAELDTPQSEGTSWPDASSHGSGRWLVKDYGSCGGLGVRWWSAGQPLASNEVLQRWIPGRIYGATLLGDGTNAYLLAVCRSLFTRQADRPFLYAGSLGPVDISEELVSPLRRLGELIVDSTGLRGLFNVDFVLDRKKTPWLIEINSRWSGSSELVERKLNDVGYADPLFRVMYDSLSHCGSDSRLVMRQRPFRGPRTQQDFCTYLKRIVFACCDSRFHRASIQRLLRYGETIHDIPADGTLIKRGEPVCTVIAQIAANEKDPMPRHRVLMRNLKRALRPN